MKLLVTGASGLVGREVVRRLAAHQVVALSRHPDGNPPAHAEPLAGDVSLPRLGLTADRYAELQRTLDGIVHAAADVRFELPLAAARAANVEGTAHVLELARGCARLTRFVHVSTVYVNGLRRGEFGEEVHPNGHAYLNTYQQSKHEAEALVAGAMGGLPAAICRLSTVIADSPEGRVSQLNYMHLAIRHLTTSPLEMIPGNPETRLDLITNDWAAGALAYLLEQRFTAGSVRHLCCGPAQALTLREAIEIGAAELEAAGQPVQIPKLVSPAEFARYLARSRSQAIRSLAGVLARFLPLLAAANTYRNELTDSDLAASGLVRPDPREYFGRVLRQCAAARWGADLP